MTSDAFQFFVNEKRHVSVISFVGRIGPTDLAEINRCVEAIAFLRGKFLVFNLAGVTAMDEQFDPAFVRLQSVAREGGRQLFVCGLTADLKKRFSASGIIRTYEVVDTLVEALQKIAAPGDDRK